MHMERLIYEGNSVYELDEDALLKRQKKQMEKFSEDQKTEIEEKRNDGHFSITKKKKKGTV